MTQESSTLQPEPLAPWGSPGGISGAASTSPFAEVLAEPGMGAITSRLDRAPQHRLAMAAAMSGAARGSTGQLGE